MDWMKVPFWDERTLISVTEQKMFLQIPDHQQKREKDHRWWSMKWHVENLREEEEHLEGPSPVPS